jgi:hypothetical protein
MSLSRYVCFLFAVLVGSPLRENQVGFTFTAVTSNGGGANPGRFHQRLHFATVKTKRNAIRTSQA